MGEIEKNVKRGTVWTTIDRFSTQLVQFFIGIVIARLVTPSEYGILGILMVFITLSQVFIDSGLGSALIFQNNKKEEDLQTTFTFNFSISAILFLLLFLISPFVESFFNLKGLSTYMRVSILVLFSNAFIVVPTAILKIDFRYNALALTNICSTLVSGIIGLGMAYCGLGIWALIGQLLSKSILQFLLIFVQCPWFPHMQFYRESFQKLYKYSVSLFSATCITKIIDESTSFFIGKLLTPISLGLYTRANQFASLPGSAFGQISLSVLFPALASVKDSASDFDKIFRKAVIYQTALCAPLFLWLSMVCEPLIRVVLTEKWIGVVPIMQILCIGRCLSPTANIMEYVLNAKGRTDLFLKQQVAKMAIKALCICMLIHWGLVAVAIADAIYTITQFWVTGYYLKSVHHFTCSKQLRAVAFYLCWGSISAIAGYFIMPYFENDYIKIISSLLVASTIYVSVILFLQKEVDLRMIFKMILFKD